MGWDGIGTALMRPRGLEHPREPQRLQYPRGLERPRGLEHPRQPLGPKSPRGLEPPEGLERALLPALVRWGGQALPLGPARRDAGRRPAAPAPGGRGAPDPCHAIPVYVIPFHTQTHPDPPRPI